MYLLLHLLCVLGLTLGAVFNNTPPDNKLKLQQGPCPKFWYSFNERCYKYDATKMNWADAELFCVSEGTNLASVHSLDELDFIQTLIKNFDPTEGSTWMGLTDIHREGGWMWSDGTKVVFTNWREGEPNNSEGKEQCADTSYLQWNDYPCNTRFPFVCKSRGD